jgi:hypothetical protein
LDRAAIKYQPAMCGNDQYPSCTVAALINAAVATEALQQAALAFDEQAWVPFYARLAGCEPTPTAIAATDGLAILDVLRAQGTVGFDIGAVAPLTGDFGTVPLVRADLARCMAGLGFVYAGVDLAQSDLIDTGPGEVWDVATPDSSLGHALLLWDYTGLDDDDHVGLVSWGGFIESTWLGIECRLREAYGLLLGGIEGPGIDIAALKVANARWLVGWPAP